MPAPSRVLLLTRRGCHLCVDAESAVRRIATDLGVSWRAVDVDEDERLRARFTDHVPVTFVDQQLHGYWFVDEAALRDALIHGAPRDMADDWIAALPLKET
ncbi:MAG: glutaredoxin family protein [Arachnia sp.]